MKEYDFEKTPIVDIVNDIIVDATNKGASDIHFDPHEKFLKIRIRIDGDLINYAIVDNKYQKNLITRIKLLAGMNITEQRLPQDGTIKGTIKEKDLDLRVSAMPTNYGEKIVIRILDYSMSLEGLESLDFTKENYDKLIKMLSFPNGIILTTGATGSGKSTTVYSMLQRLNNEQTNIITVEDPIEMNIDGMNQVQVNSEIGLDFATILRSILRQDPNVILIGEIRDSETAKIAVRASITGHLVLSTLHTNNSLTTIERLVDMDVEKYLLSSSLKGIISQTLAKKLCTCKIKRPTTEAEKKVIQKALGIELNEVYDVNKDGCDKCKNGYKGRIAIQEVLLINDEIANAINNGTEREKLKNLIYSKDHAKTILQDGLLKVLNGLTTISEVFRLVDIDSDATNIYGNNTKEDNITENYINMPIIEEKKVKPVVVENKNINSNQNQNINSDQNKNIDKNKQEEKDKQISIASSVIENINKLIQNKNIDDNDTNKNVEQKTILNDIYQETDNKSDNDNKTIDLSSKISQEYNDFLAQKKSDNNTSNEITNDNSMTDNFQNQITDLINKIPNTKNEKINNENKTDDLINIINKTLTEKDTNA